MADGPHFRSTTKAVLGALLLSCTTDYGCPATHDFDDASVLAINEAGDAGGADAPAAMDAGSCARPRTVTLVVVVSSDGANDLRELRAELVAEIVTRLISGDTDGDGEADSQPVQEIRVMATYNEICLGDEYEGYDGEWVAPRDGICGGDDASIVQVVRAGEDWHDELRCRLVPRRDALGCVPEPLEAALVALSTGEEGIDLSPAVPLGGGVNSAWRDREDLVVLLLEAADWRDDCSRRIEIPADCGSPDAGGGGFCCLENLGPVSRTSDGLTRIFGERPYVVASLGMHPAFDARTDDPARLDEWLSEGLPAECAVMRPHRRMVELARQLHPNMDLVPLTCDGARLPDIADVGPFARHVLSRICE